ncbi:MAG: hypothetical protein H6868_03165 [Rhodospirillales bacterium]|nr:hypothetical protein [Rhodospirillales bacterium]
MTKLSAQMVGRLGELAVERELLKRGWMVGNFNANIANAAAYDLFAVKGRRRVCLRVKTTSGHMIQYTVKSHGSAFNDLSADDDGDFVAIVLMEGEEPLAFYLVPSTVVDETLRTANEEWLQHPKKDGSPRKKTNHRALDFKGDKTPSAPHKGMGKRWEQYKDAWKILEKGA